MKWITILILCLSIVGCSNVLDNLSTQNNTEEYDMNWYYKHNGYAIMKIVDTRNQPVMEVIAIPLNSRALMALIHEDVKDVNLYLKSRFRAQRPVMYLSVYAHRDCIFSWPFLKLKQSGGVAVPVEVIPPKSPLVAAAGRLFDRYGERRVRQVDQYMGLVSNPYTGRDMFEMRKEIELAQGESLSSIAIFSGGLKLNRPLYLICKSQRYATSSGNTYTTRKVSKMIKIYAPAKY